MASSRENRGATRKNNLPYHQSVEYDEYEEYEEYEEEYQHPNENADRTYNRNALYHSEYTEGEGEYEEHEYNEYREGNYEESEYAEYIDPDSPTSPSNGHPLPSPPPSPPTDDGYDDEDNNSSIPPPPPIRSKKLPSIPQYVPDKSQTSRMDDKSQSRMAFRPSAPTPTHQKRKINYFTIGKSLTSRLKFKKSHAKEEEIQDVDPPLPEPPQRLQITLPSLAPSSPISHQLPAEYLEFEEEADNHSEVHTTPELTMDDLYHLVLNMQKGFQLQVDEMNTQIKELKREIKKLKGEDEESEEEEVDNDLEDLRSPSRTATSVRSVTKEMERYGGEGRWFHNEYS